MRGSERAAAVRWLALAGPAPDAIPAALLGLPGADARLEPLPDPGGDRDGSRSMRATLRSGQVLFARLYPARPRQRGLQALARRLRPDAARREWRALRRLAARGAPVPEPRALGRLPGGERLLVTGLCEGPSLAAALAAGTPGRAVAAEVGAAIARLHGAGFVHGDLRARDVLLAGGGPVLVGLRSARRSRSRRARLRDLAALEHSIAGRIRLVDRVRLRAAALGLRRPFDADARRSLDAVARLARARGLAHARACMRRARRPGPGSAVARAGELRGLRDPGLAPQALAAAVAAPPGLGGARRRVRFAPAGARRVAVKEFATGLCGAIADLARGSPARRGWLAGRGLAALGVGAASPLAYLERRRFGLPFASVLVQEDLCPALAADSPGPGAGAAERIDALACLALALHAAGAAHRDLTAGNVLLVRGARGLSARLVDLEDARIPRRLVDRARAKGLAQLNASLPDWIPAALRRRAFRRYATWLPFRAPRARVLARIVSTSVARRHHWSGRGCLGRQEAEIVIQRKELEEPGMRPPLPTS